MTGLGGLRGHALGGLSYGEQSQGVRNLDIL